MFSVQLVVPPNPHQVDAGQPSTTMVTILDDDSESNSHTHSPTHTHTHTHSLTHSHTHSLIHSLTHPLSHTHSLTDSHILTHSLTHSPTHPLSHILAHSSTHSLTLFLSNPVISVTLTPSRVVVTEGDIVQLAVFTTGALGRSLSVTIVTRTNTTTCQYSHHYNPLLTHSISLTQ